MKPLTSIVCIFAYLTITPYSAAQDISYEADPFRQLDEILPTPTDVRLASGAPGPKYWQQRADYKIKIELDDLRRRLKGSETITYHNNSPHSLPYLWLQLDQNRFRPDSEDLASQPAPDFKQFGYKQLKSHLNRQKFEGGYDISVVTDSNGNPLSHTIVKTMMRIDLATPLKSGSSFVFKVDWSNNIMDAKTTRVRGGYEYFKEDDNNLYEIAQWFPRMAAYTDYSGWQHKQFLGNGEFTLEFGDYEVDITVPSDHVVAATGELQNANDVLTQEQQNRLNQAEGTGELTFIVTPDEAKQNEVEKSSDTKTWTFHATNVRDFAWASSRKFIWDALAYKTSDKTVWCMSYYPNAGEPLWSRYSTRAVAHTLDVYSKYSFKYPYPVAISVNGPIGGMEYPMICFNGPRPEEDGTYSLRTKAGLISVIIHEVGHNYFPMIVNTDERQWTWMDEGINTFLQYLSEREWEEKYPSRRGAPRHIVGYMSSHNQVPIMTNSESILQFGNNAYAKPATALNVLRETVLGRELFDFAFRQYAQQWEFKRPEPADFFRIMEDASGVDLDWFWRGWFYTTHEVDIALTGLRLYEIDTHNPDIENAIKRDKRDDIEGRDLTDKRNQGLERVVDRFPNLKDFYNDFDELDVTPKDRREYNEFLDGLEDDERELLNIRQKFYVLDMQNVGGLVMPVHLRVSFADGTSKDIRMPAEIWRRNPKQVSRLIMSKEEIAKIELDPQLESADTNRQNNFWPPKPIESRFKLFKHKKEKNPMQQARKEESRAKNAADDTDEDSETKGKE